MRFEKELTDLATLHEMGERLRFVRVQQNMTRAELAERSGVSVQSVGRLESGRVGSRLSTFIAICRALGLLERFDLLLPPPVAQPMDLLKLAGKRRRRARKRKPVQAGPWEWGEPS